jgi:hypothetical protein
VIAATVIILGLTRATAPSMIVACRSVAVAKLPLMWPVLGVLVVVALLAVVIGKQSKQ